VEDAQQMGVGISLIVASQALQALQMWMEREQRWREERTQRLSPLGVAGCEGVIGLALTVRVTATGGIWAQPCECAGGESHATPGQCSSLL
jgi:hypothetical protein